MPKWKVIFVEDADNDLGKLAKVARKRILGKLSWLENHFDLTAPIPLSAEWSGFFKIRVGDYRIIYKIDWGNAVLIIIAIGHRSRIYKK